MWRLQQPSACTPAVPCAEKAPMVLLVAHKIALVGRIFPVLQKATGLFATRIFMHDAHWQCTWPSLSGWGRWAADDSQVRQARCVAAACNTRNMCLRDKFLRNLRRCVPRSAAL